jgi:hypothetical protein
VIQQGFDTFLKALAKNFRAAGKIIAKDAPFGAHLITGKQQGNGDNADD